MGDQNPTNYEDAFRSRLRASGWQLLNLNFRSTGWLAWGVPFSILVEANVPDEYTNDQHAGHLSEVLSNYELCLPGGWNCGRVITNINLGWRGADKQFPATPGAIQPPPIKENPYSVGTPPGKVPPGGNTSKEKEEKKFSEAYNEFWEGLGIGAGIGTAILVVGLVAVLRK